MNILWQGSRGSAINTLQARLKTVGFDPGAIDGVFGPSTAAAVTAFQKDRQLVPDGIVGPQTFKELSLGSASSEASGQTRSKIFVSYSHDDERWLKMFQLHIAPLERSGMVEKWDDTQIAPGSQWKDEIAQAIQSAKAAVLLLSPNFMASKFIAESELPALLKAAQRDGLAIFPVNIRPCTLGELKKFQAVNPPSQPLCDLKTGDRDRIWVKLVEDITTALNE